MPSSEIFYFNVKHHIAANKLVIIGSFLTICKNLECNLYIFLFFWYGILPVVIFILLVHGLLDHLWQLCSKLMGPFNMSVLHFFTEDIILSFLQDMMNSSIKGRLILNALGYSIIIRQPGLAATHYNWITSPMRWRCPNQLSFSWWSPCLRP